MAAKKKSTLKIQQVRSPIGFDKKQAEVLPALWVLRRIRHTVEREDTPAVRGMRWRKISHLVTVIED
jgi:large subunit ribosomal protein L30